MSGKIPYIITKTNYGEVYEFNEKIRSISGGFEYARIIAAVQKGNGKTTYRIITCYPDKNEQLVI